MRDRLLLIQMICEKLYLVKNVLNFWYKKSKCFLRMLILIEKRH